MTGGRRYFDRPDPGLTTPDTRDRASPSNTLLLNLFAVRLGMRLGNAERREAKSGFLPSTRPFRGGCKALARIGTPSDLNDVRQRHACFGIIWQHGPVGYISAIETADRQPSI